MTPEDAWPITEHDYAEGDRVEVVHWWIDEGDRIWPVFEDGKPVSGKWRAVRVADDGRTFEELGPCEAGRQEIDWPGFTFSINDNENVPPGTQGTVHTITKFGYAVDWDNGSGLHPASRDEIKKV